MSRLFTCLCCLFLAMMPTLVAQPCELNHQLCSPGGRTSNQSPVDWSSNGTLLAEFYEDLVNSVNNQPSKRYQPAEDLNSKASSVNLCCTSNTQCLLLQKFLVPFCWDRFTTNYFLPDDSYGNVAGGNYTLISGEMNLITGYYTRLPGKANGNLYGKGESPNTSTLQIPTPWTSKGVGIAIPASEVGETSNITASSGTATRTITLPSSSISTSISSSVDAASRTSTPTIVSVAGSTSCSLPGLLLVTMLMVLG